jgi:hypothetical protein
MKLNEKIFYYYDINFKGGFSILKVVTLCRFNFSMQSTIAMMDLIKCPF